MAKARKSIEAELIASMAQAVEFAKGKRAGFRIHEFSPEDVRLIRAKTHKSQSEFARAYGISLKTLQKWERGEARPTGPAASLLQVIRTNPRVVEKALAKVA